MKVNVPIPFQGTKEEAEANFQTHSFDGFPGELFSDSRCMYCDCKPWHAAAKYPCGVEPPRETIVSRGNFYIRDRIASDLHDELNRVDADDDEN